MKIKLLYIKAGDFVYCTGDSSFCASSCANEKVAKVTVQYDQKTGKPYNVIWLSGERKFDSRHGGAMNPPLAYYIIPTDQEKAKAEQDEKDRKKAEGDKAWKERQEQKKAILSKLTKEEREILGL